MTIEKRIFIGYLLSKELKIHLNQNGHWKEAKLSGEFSLKETTWQDKEYIGSFAPAEYPYNQLKEKEEEVRTQLQIYCPKLNLDKQSIYLFSQLFLF